MQIYLLRHGTAEDPRDALNDAERALLPEGKEKLRRVLALAAEAGAQPELMISSPLKRAIQTAKIAQEILAYKGDILRMGVLEPGARVEDVWNEIRIHKDRSSVLLVGHNPLFAELSGYLLGCPDLQIDFKAGGMLRLDTESFMPRPRAILRWYLTPKVAACVS
jgi:phosphohistidine phosphatase